jgi:hypothetical protein
MSEQPTVFEAAFSWGGDDNGWFARITWKCSICGRRNCELMKGPGPISSALPIEVTCKQKHKIWVVPYRWKESELFNKSAA